jgi:hypothetical protein
VPNNPVFDTPDPFVLVPTGVKVHHWPEMSGWVGAHKITAEDAPAVHHECYYIVADTFAALEAFRAMPQSGFQVGQLAYILGPQQQFVVWAGTGWAGIRMLAPAASPIVNAPNTVTGTNNAGIISVGTVGTANIVLTFSVPCVAIPSVAISWTSNLCQVQAIATLTNVTFKSNNNQIDGKKISYICQ